MKIGKCQILGELGRGAHSTILQVRRADDGKTYALKLVPIDDPEEDTKYLEQARHEFAVSQKLDHPNLIKIHAFETQRDWLFRIRKARLLIEYVNGKTLDTVKRIPMPQLVQVFARIAAGMTHMHRRGVFHADLKPNNILLGRGGAVKVIDYGLAWIKGEDKDRVQGTPEYMAPEQARKKVVNAQSDIYNFGATMYRLVTWRHPPNPIGDGQIATDARSWNQLLKPVQQCSAEAPPELCTLIQRCLDYRPDKRPARMGEVQEELDKLAAALVRSPTDELEALEF